ncbi:MAG: rubrerythrin family protein [Hyphomicrobiales bacterium]|nr:rubrerythrin family protein [Hyphomicrobiales bacterium]
MSTIEDLQYAFAGESQANRRYLAYAEKAEAEGLPGVAKLFRAVAAAETIHALAHLKAMDGVAGTAANLAEAMAGEKHEFTEMYPPMVANAEAEGHRKAARSMRFALAVEKVHYDLFEAALAAVAAGKDLGDVELHVCPVCGHTVIGPVEGPCPVCGCRADLYDAIA